MLSNQVSNYLSQYTSDVDVGINYRPKDQMTNDEIEVALSTKLLNDRVSIGGNIDYGGTEHTANENTTKHGW
ncbi:MAG: hypothetical protein HC896_01115 [Bacteroidales bacterium]|nr:hypothetical protein [Bacteroidales bacterium]